MDNSLLAVDKLTVERGGRIVLSDLDLVLAHGQTILVSGRNGAGKSTLLRTLAGLLQPTRGRITFGMADEETRGVETVHYLGYEDALKPSLTVGENLAFWAAMLKSETRSFVGAFAGTAMPAKDALGSYGIARLIDLPAAYLSAGQKRRVALARLLLSPRPIWLLDEPLIALDTTAQSRVIAIMREHLAAGGGVLVASHQPLGLPTLSIDLDAALEPAGAI